MYIFSISKKRKIPQLQTETQSRSQKKKEKRSGVVRVQLRIDKNQRDKESKTAGAGATHVNSIFVAANPRGNLSIRARIRELATSGRASGTGGNLTRLMRSRHATGHDI